MNIRVALTFRSLLLASVLLASAKAESVLAQPAAKPTVKPPRAAPQPGSAGPQDGDEDRADLPDIKPFETGIDYKPTSPRTKVTFNLEDADLPDLVRLISQITGKRFILPAKGRSVKATVYAPTKVTAAEAYQAFLSILELNGLALVPSAGYMKIVESGRVEGRPIPLYTEGDVPNGDRFITRLHRVEHIAAEDAAQLLERFKSGDGSMTAYAPTNTLIITDTGTNLRRMLRILQAIDVARTGQQVWVEPVHHATASELASQLSEIFDTETSDSTPNKATPRKPTPRKATPRKPANSTGGVTTIGSGGAAESRISKILADERTNSLIIVATEAAYMRILEMLKHLDTSLQGEGRIHVHHLQHSDAEEVASTLSSLVGGSSSGGGAARRGPTPRGGSPATSGDLGSIFEGKVAITAHKAANSLVITSSTHDYASLRHVIDELDVERRQVFIEAVIMELSVNRASKLGLSYHGGIPDAPSDGSLLLSGFDATKSLSLQSPLAAAASGDLLSGFAVGIRGPELVGFNLPSFGVAINALSDNQDANVLSTPHLIAMDNVEAEISIGQNVPLQTSAPAFGGGNLGSLAGLAGSLGGSSGLNAGMLGGLSSLGGLGGFGGSVPRQDVGTTLTITPHINDSNDIRLEIAEEISEAGPPSDTGNLGVVPINRTQAKTEVVVRDQETVVIGGLMRDGVTSTVRKVPILGDIPLLGALFRSTTKNKTKRNLLLFLTPYIIRSPSDLRSIYERKIRERQEFLDRYFVAETDEYEPPTDYSRTRGLLGEILLELNHLREERELIAEAAKKPELTHEPRPAVGEAAHKGRAQDDFDENSEDVLVIDESGDGGDPAAEPPPPGGMPPMQEMIPGGGESAPPPPAPPGAPGEGESGGSEEE